MSDHRDEREYEEEDDGRTIANMNVEGMPWYVRESPDAVEGEKTPLNKQERRMYIWAAVRAALLIGAAFGVVFLAAILFMLFVWTR